MVQSVAGVGIGRLAIAYHRNIKAATGVAAILAHLVLSPDHFVWSGNESRVLCTIDYEMYMYIELHTPQCIFKYFVVIVKVTTDGVSRALTALCVNGGLCVCVCVVFVHTEVHV